MLIWLYRLLLKGQCKVIMYMVPHGGHTLHTLEEGSTLYLYTENALCGCSCMYMYMCIIFILVHYYIKVSVLLAYSAPHTSSLPVYSNPPHYFSG